MHLKITKLSTEAHLPTPRYDQYLTHVQKPVRAGKRRVIGLVWELLSCEWSLVNGKRDLANTAKRINIIKRLEEVHDNKRT